MDEMWKNRDLKLIAEKKQVGQTDVTKEEWTRHVVDLKDGEEIRWASYSGFYRSPYEGPHAFHFTLLEATYRIALRVVGNNTTRVISLGANLTWSSGWYEVDGWCYRVTIKIIQSIYSVSELPDGVRTMQQQDHDAWEYAVQNGLI
jgi:hypothetical protein